MSISGNAYLWWDRERDATGKLLRQDVRNAGHAIWDQACARARAVLGESSDAAALMERSVAQVSRCLDRAGATPNATDTAAVLMCAFCRALRRYAAKLRRIEFVGDVTELSQAGAMPPSRAPSKEECLLDALKVARRLSPRARMMLTLRVHGCEWKEIAAVLKTTDCAARAEFSREVKKAKAQNESARSVPRASTKDSCQPE